MTTLAPPTVAGPVLATSTTVRVDGVLAGAAVQVADENGSIVAAGPSAVNGTARVPITQPLGVGARLVAQQSRGGSTSQWSSTATAVVAAPRDLPRPVVECLLNQCSDAVLVSGLVPGADILVKDGATVIGQEVAADTRAWIRLTSTAAVGSTISVEAHLAGSNPSPLGWSEPVTRTDLETGLGTPQVLGPLTACATYLDVRNVAPTAEVVMTAEDGSTTTWHAPASEFRALLRTPLQEGAIVLQQVLPGCQIQSDRGKSPVGAELKPPAPRPWAFCPQSRRIRVDGLLPQATVTFATASTGPDGVLGPETEVMVAGAVGGTQEFDLPRILGGVPGPIVHMYVRQTLCTLPSDPGYTREYIRPGEGGGVLPTATPQIAQPVHTCATSVRLSPSGWGVGVVRSAVTGDQLADAFSGMDTIPMTLPLWFPLSSGEQIVVEYTGCSAPGKVGPVPVMAVPNPMPDLVLTPPLPGDTDVVIRGAFPGARVVAMLDQSPVAIATSQDGTARVPLGRTLVAGDRVGAYQRLCGAAGNPERYVVVRPATLAASVAPYSARAGEPTTVTVTATRADTREVVGGLPVRVGSAVVGLTGTAFAWTPTAAGTIGGVVAGGARYSDATFSLTAAPPLPPPPAGLALTLQIGGAAVAVTDLRWRVQPHWGGGAVTGTGTPTTVPIPAPGGGGIPVVSVFIDAVKVTVGGVELPVDLPSPVTNVGFTKPAMHAGFLVWVEQRTIADSQGQPWVVDVAMIRWQGTA